MLLLHLTALFVYLFGAYAYGGATVVSLRRQAKPVWGAERLYSEGVRERIDRASLALFATSFVWFVLHTLIEFQSLVGDPREGWLSLGTLVIAYLFPPVIMHTLYLEAHHADQPAPPRIYGRLLAAMYVLSPLVGAWSIAAIFGYVPRPTMLGSFIGISIGAMFTIASVYSTTLMLRRPRHERTTDQLRLRNVMIFLFFGMILLFAALSFMREERLLVSILDRASRAAPLYFMIASVYFESRFEFYDLVVKRALLMLMSILTVGVYLFLTLEWLVQLPDSPARPWFFAIALVPVALVLPWLRARTERWLDRMWFGREFTAIEAIKHMLAAMQSATDPPSLIKATEERLFEIFGARIKVLIGDAPPPEGAVVLQEIAMPRPSAPAVRFAVLRAAGMRRVMSEDMQLLRHLSTVFGFMIEKLQMERKRLEQEQLAQELRLQTSKSELKALRAQINPHFLFNALNAIASLIHTDPARADEAVEQLAEVFRYTLRRSDSEWAPLDQELAFARAYLDVEQARFGQRLTCSIDSDHLPPAPQVPSMMLQTLIENAIKHGVSQTRGPGRIDVVVRTTSDQVTVEVRDTGPGGEAPAIQPREGEGFGLRSVRERLRGHFGDRATLSLTRDEAAGVTIARIVMPVVRMAA